MNTYQKLRFKSYKIPNLTNFMLLGLVPRNVVSLVYLLSSFWRYGCYKRTPNLQNPLTVCHDINSQYQGQLSHITRKCIFGDFRPGKVQTSLLSYSYNLETLDRASIYSILPKQRTTKVLIRLRGCTGWSALLLFAYAIRHIFAWPGPVYNNIKIGYILCKINLAIVLVCVRAIISCIYCHFIASIYMCQSPKMDFHVKKNKKKHHLLLKTFE